MTPKHDIQKNFEMLIPSKEGWLNDRIVFETEIPWLDTQKDLKLMKVQALGFKMSKKAQKLKLKWLRLVGSIAPGEILLSEQFLGVNVIEISSYG